MIQARDPGSPSAVLAAAAGAVTVSSGAGVVESGKWQAARCLSGLNGRSGGSTSAQISWAGGSGCGTGTPMAA